VTLSIKTPVGYEVASILLNGYKKVNAVYNEETKEYEYVFANLSDYYDVVIYTQKKAYPAELDPKQYTITLGSLGEGTFCSEYDLDFRDVDGLTAYIASGFNPETGNIVLTKVWDVPRGTGLMIRGIQGTYEIPVTTTNFYFKNLMVGVVEQIDALEASEWVDGVEYANYTLKKAKDGNYAVFSRADGGKLAANRSYLQIPSYMIDSSSSKSRTIGYEFDDGTTAIKDLMIFEDTEGGDYYNLQGQKVQNPGKGIFIKNGKKVIIR
jgi:hypothetical protein